MLESNMTEEDWSKYIMQWESSFTPINPDLVNYDVSVEITEKPVREVTVVAGRQLVDYIRIERSSAKAHFFVTEDSMSGTFGFWCPKGLVDSKVNGKVDLPEWFEPKIIEFL